VFTLREWRIEASVPIRKEHRTGLGPRPIPRGRDGPAPDFSVAHSVGGIQEGIVEPSTLFGLPRERGHSCPPGLVWKVAYSPDILPARGRAASFASLQNRKSFPDHVHTQRVKTAVVLSFLPFGGVIPRTRIDLRHAPPSISLPGPPVAGHIIHIPILQLLPRPWSFAQEGEAGCDRRIEHETADRNLLRHAFPAMSGHGRTQDRLQSDPMQGIVGMRKWRRHEITGDTRRLPHRKPLLCRTRRVPRITACASGSRGSAGGERICPSSQPIQEGLVPRGTVLDSASLWKGSADTLVRRAYQASINRCARRRIAITSVRRGSSRSSAASMKEARSRAFCLRKSLGRLCLTVAGHPTRKRAAHQNRESSPDPVPA